MASANVELVRSICSAWEQGDYSSSEWADPEIAWVIADGPAPGVWTGHEGMSAGWGDFLSAWEGGHLYVDEYRELDDERVLVLARFGGRGKTSGLEVGQLGTGALLFHLADDKATRFVTYWDRKNAVAELGLA